MISAPAATAEAPINFGESGSRPSATSASSAFRHIAHTNKQTSPSARYLNFNGGVEYPANNKLVTVHRRVAATCERQRRTTQIPRMVVMRPIPVSYTHLTLPTILLV